MSETVKTCGYDYIRTDSTWHRTLNGEIGADVSKYGGEEMLCILDALASAQAALRDVQKVETWMKGEAHANYVAWDEEGFVAIAAMEYAPNERATADSLAALGRLLPDTETDDA